MPGLIVTVCGGGNATHALAALLPNVADIAEVNILTTFGDEAERFAKAAATQNGEVVVSFRGEGPEAAKRGKPTRITNDPSVVATSDVIVMAVPSFAHEGYLKAVAPHIRSSGGDASKTPEGRVLIGAMPGEGGFDFQVRHILGQEKFDQICCFALETLPWAVRLTDYGKAVEILGTKFDVDIAATPSNLGPGVRDVVQKLMGQQLPRLNLIPCMLAVTLMNINSVWHPTITWGAYRDWDFKTPFEKEPLFYEGVDDVTADKLDKISNEILQVKKYLESKHNLDLTGLRHVQDWMVYAYGDDIGDKTNLRTMLNTNKGYLKLTHPTTKTEDGKFMPNFKYRYMSEDVPMGLVVTRGVAEMCGVATPNMDDVINFACKAAGKKYFGEDGKVAGAPDVGKTRSPQAFGINSIEEMIKMLKY